MTEENNMNPITEDDIANYLANTPDFFERHASLLAAVQLTSPHGNRAVSLQERQAEMLREKIKALEHRVMDMVRHGNENMIIADRLQRWARNLFMVQSGRALPATIVAEIQHQFMVPQVAMKVWDVDAKYGKEPFAEGVSEDAKTFASSLTQPYCGVNSGFEAVQWLDRLIRIHTGLPANQFTGISFYSRLPAYFPHRSAPANSESVAR